MVESWAIQCENAGSKSREQSLRAKSWRLGLYPIQHSVITGLALGNGLYESLLLRDQNLLDTLLRDQ